MVLVLPLLPSSLLLKDPSSSFLPPSQPNSTSIPLSYNGRNLRLERRSYSSPRAFSNGYLGGITYRPPRRSYLRMDSCLVVPPPKGRKPVAIIKFLGGAFVGAVPEVTYSHLMELLAKEGFLVVSVPYKVTFYHEMAAREVYERFHACFDELLASGVPEAGITPLDISCLPLYSVGHSNGALLQMLVGSYFSEKLPEANAIVSFNNRPAAEAVPYFEQFGPMVSQVVPAMEALPMYTMARNASGDAWKTLLDTAGTLIMSDQEAMVSLNKFVDQLPSVMNQVMEGTSEFKPTPSENREFFRKSYSIPRTLLVKFSSDPIDETDLLEEILKPRVESIGGGRVEKVTLPGNHLTPCVQDLKWQVGPQYTPADAIAQRLKSLSINDTRVLSRTIADWFKNLNIE